MRDIPDELADRIEGGAATMCHAWVVRRADGASFGFTDHDRDLTVEGVVCRAGSGWTAGAASGGEGLSPGTVAAAGVLDDAAITEAALAAGLWDGARVELWRVDWDRPDLRVRLSVSTVSKVWCEGEAFRAGLDGPMAALERVVGRTYGRACDAILGDARCGVELDEGSDAVCDKRWATCRAVFGNGLNFRGFPDIPGDDFLTVHPVGGGTHDGGSRR